MTSFKSLLVRIIVIGLYLLYFNNDGLVNVILISSVSASLSASALLLDKNSW